MTIHPRTTSAVLLVIDADCVSSPESTNAIRAIAPGLVVRMHGDADTKTRLDIMRAKTPHRALVFGPLWTGEKLTPTGAHVRALLAGGYPVRWISRPRAKPVDLTTMPASAAREVEST